MFQVSSFNRSAGKIHMITYVCLSYQPYPSKVVNQHTLLKNTPLSQTGYKLGFLS